MSQMCVTGTPLEHYPDLGLWVKREDLCCPGGPNFSKTRGVYAHVASRPEKWIGVLDTLHSQGGWAVAKACRLLGKHCALFYPVRKADTGQLRPQWLAARAYGAHLLPLQAGRSAILYHRAKVWLNDPAGPIDAYMMPNALKLPESVAETALEVERTDLPRDVHCAIISASSGTIAAGVCLGLWQAVAKGYKTLPAVIHLGYSRPQSAVQRYIGSHTWGNFGDVPFPMYIVDEGYSYADKARSGVNPPFPCNEYYDLKAFRWWMDQGRQRWGQALFWNIG